MKRVLNINEASEMLGFTKSYVYKLTSQGVIPHSKPNGKTLFFDRIKLEEWMLSNSHDGNISQIAQSIVSKLLT
jgi:excisionase family DNA binding protein